jgi:hypothetical protein
LGANNQVLLAAMCAIEEHFDRSIAGLGGDVNERLGRNERHLDLLECRFTAFEFQVAGIVSQSPRLRSAMAN